MCTQHVSVGNVVSELTELLYGVPRGSVMGIIKYFIYTLPIGISIQSCGLHYSIYSDDTHLYLSFNINDSEAAFQKLNSCLDLTSVLGY